METQDIRKEDELHGRIKRLTHQTLLSLLRTYDHESKVFYGSIQSNHSTWGTWRDTALVLMALQQSIEAMRRDRRKADTVPVEKQGNWKQFEEELEKNLRKFNEGRLETERVDMWATAAGLLFLIAYGRLCQHLLKLKMAETFDFSRPTLRWSAIVDAELNKSCENRVTSRIYENYIRPFKETGESNHSAMVLHGPPGTAKSTLAQAIAAELEWSLVTITPSDFVKEGIEQSENKARQLFKELLLLRETVVLFDELDEMLRDRQDQQSQTGIAMLRFLIPGMLPKLQMLKQFGEKNRLIFIIATNYKDRLDSAVIRTGRVDDAFAVVPPDEPSRYCLIWNFLHNAGYPEIERERLASFLAARTQGWVYKEIEHLVGLVRKKMLLHRNDGEEKNLRKLFGVRDISPKHFPNITLSAYRSYNILGQQAALDIFDFYRGRDKAWKEILSVLRAYGVDTRSRNPSQQQDLVHWVTGKPSRQGL